MSTAPSRVYAARLVGLPIFDPQGDQVGKVRDLVVAIRSEGSQPRVLGLVAEVFGRRRIFVPMTRVTNIDSGQVYTTGLLNMRRFEQRPTETLVVGQLFDRTVTITSSGITGTIYDVAMEQARNRDWVLSRIAIQEPAKALRRRGQTHVVEWGEVEVGTCGVRLSSVEDRHLRFPPLSGNARRDHAKRHMRRIEPMMGNGRYRVWRGGRPVRKRRWSESRFSGQARVELPAQ